MTDVEVGKEYKINRPTAKGWYKVVAIRTRENGEVVVEAKAPGKSHTNSFKLEDILVEEERNKKVSKGVPFTYTVLGKVGEINGLPVEAVEVHSCPGARGRRKKND